MGDNIVDENKALRGSVPDKTLPFLIDNIFHSKHPCKRLRLTPFALFLWVVIELPILLCFLVRNIYVTPTTYGFFRLLHLLSGILKK